MLIFLLLGHTPWVLMLALGLVLWLTVVELLELRPHYIWWFWWLLLVALLNFPGYLILRVYSYFHKRRRVASA